MEDAARQQGVNLLTLVGKTLRRTENFDEQANVLYALVDARRFDGLIIWASGQLRLLSEAEREAFCRGFGVPVVTIEGSVKGFPCVTCSNYQGMRLAVDHLLDAHGYRRIGFAGMLQHHIGFQERYRAYAEALTAHNLEIDPYLAQPYFPAEAVGEEGLIAEDAFMAFLQRAINAGVEAIIGVSDTTAIQTLTSLQRLGLRVPHDIAVIGFDDFRESQVLTPPLTTVNPSWYELGQQAVVTLLDVLAGHSITQHVVPPQLRIRQSCGCADLAVRHAGERPECPAIQVSSNRQEMAAAMLQTVQGMAAISNPQSVEQMVTGFLNDLTGDAEGEFLPALEMLLHQLTLSPGNVADWQDWISTLRQQAFRGLPPGDRLLRSETLWQQARVLIGNLLERRQAYQRVQAEQYANLVRDVGQALITTFDVAGIMGILAGKLPLLGIPRCYLAVFETPHPYTYPDAAPEWARLVLAYDARGRVPLDAEGRRFPARQLCPPEILPAQTVANFVVEPLYFREYQLGFALFESGPREGKIYETLRGEISSALYGALLVERVQHAAVELAHKNAALIRERYVLDTFMANVPDSIYFKDQHGRIIQANQALIARFGLHDAAEVVGKTDFDFFPEEQARPKYEQEQAILRSGQPLLALEEPDVGGGWALTTKMPLRDEHGAIIGTFGISRDITHLKRTEQELLRHQNHLEELVAERTTELTQANTHLQAEIVERTRAEHALRISEQQYRLLAESVMDGVLIVQAGNVMFTNAVFAALLRQPPEQLMMSTALSLFHDRTKPFAQDRLAGSANEFPESRWQAEMLAHDGRVLWAEIDQTPIVWNNTPSLLLTIRDITDRKLREHRLEEERTRLQHENLTLKSTIAERYRFGAIVGKSLAMQRIYELILSAATSDVNVLLLGESGTGKELLARTIHQLSMRKEHAFVAVNCASIPETLFEREFFGHRRGTFTGADRDRPGLFDQAHRGTLFLDEVTELTPGAQAKLLRVLQDGSYTPLGSTTPKQADVLIVAATNKDCQSLIAQGGLREDFFYRVGVIEIQIPALRERKEDLPLLIDHLLEHYRRKQEQLHGSAPRDLPADQAALPDELVRAIYNYEWPGNVRELQNILHRYLATRRLDLILPRLGATASPRSFADLPTDLNGVPLPDAVKTFEKRIIAEVLAQHQGHTGPAAEHLGITQRTLQNKIKQYRLREKG